MLTFALAVWLLTGVWLAWMLIRQPLPAAPAMPPDPHAAEVADFRRAVSDWDRG